MAINKNTENTIEEKVEVKSTPAKKATARKAAPKQVDISKKVPVINMSQAGLFYSARKGNGFLELDEYLDMDYMAIEDLQIMKNTARGMFKKGWLFIDDEEAVEYLGLTKEMNAILQPEELEDFFMLSTDEIKANLAEFSPSTKETVYQAMKNKFENGEMSNVHTIRAIEDEIGIDSTASVLNQ